MELTFSTDYVSLQISGPDVADLSFCDLPGEIRLVSLMIPSYNLTSFQCRFDRGGRDGW